MKSLRACLVVLFLGCLWGCASSSSEITPAESTAAQKSYRLTGESAKKHKTRIVFRKTSNNAIGDTSEDK